MRRAIALTVVAAVGLTVLAVMQLGLVAHPGPHPPSPPTYDYDTALPGTQPPTAAELSNPRGRLFEALRLQVGVIVPWEDVEKIMPPGFTANPLPPPNAPGRANIGLLFDFQGRCELLAEGIISEPGSGVFVTHIARNTALNRDELLILAAEFSDASYVNCVNEVWGPGSAHLADVTVRIEEKRGQVQLGFEVEDESIGLNIGAQATAPGPIVERGFNGDPTPYPLRSLHEGMYANPAHRFAVMGDNLFVPTTEVNLRLRVGSLHIGDHSDDTRDRKRARRRLGLPGGLVKVLGAGSVVAFYRGFEFFYQPE